MVRQASTPDRKPRWMHLVGVVIEMAINVALPALIFMLMRGKTGDLQALMLSSAPPILWSIVTFIRERKFDAISLLVLTGIALSLAAFIGGGDIKFLQLRENLVIGLVGLIFLASVFLNRPLILHLARAGIRRASPDSLQGFDRLREDVGFRRAMTGETLLWACSLLLTCAVNCALVFALPIDTFMLVSGPISYAALGVTTVLTYRRVPRAIKTAQARLAPPAGEANG